MSQPHFDICIIGAGISGLSTAAFLLSQNPESKILIIEKNDTPGGAVSTYQDKGYLAEWGPHGFLDNCNESKFLIKYSGLEEEKDMAPLEQFVRYICLDGELKCIPQKPLQIIRQPLVSLPAKMRFVRGLWKTPLSGTPSVANWVEHTFGKAILPFADAVFTGTYAGDIERLQIDAVMPGIRELEKQHGSLFKALLNRPRKQKKEKCQQPKTLPSMTSFKNGMQRLPEALAGSLGKTTTILYNTEARALSRQKQCWCIDTGEKDYYCNDVVVALPVNGCLSLFKDAELSFPTPPVQAIAEAKIATVLFGFSRDANIPFGFGYLAPEKEQRFNLGTLFSSHMFPGRAPEDCQLVEALVGGRRHPERLELDDTTLFNEVYNDLKQLIRLPGAPIFKKVLRPTAGIPQLEAGYGELLNWRNKLLQADRTLHICGFGWKGIGINDMTKEAARMARRITSRQAGEEGSELKGIYF